MILRSDQGMLKPTEAETQASSARQASCECKGKVLAENENYYLVKMEALYKNVHQTFN